MGGKTTEYLTFYDDPSALLYVAISFKGSAIKKQIVTFFLS